MFCCKFCQGWMRGVAFVRNVRSEHTRPTRQQTFLPHARHMFNALASTQMISARLLRPIGVIENHQVKLQRVLMKPLPYGFR